MRGRLALALLCFLALAGSAPVAQPRYGFELLTISTAAVPITPAVLSGMQGCTVTLEGDDIRYRYDGTAPTTTVGVLATNGSTLVLPTIQAARNLLMIRDNATDVSGWVQCWSAP